MLEILGGKAKALILPGTDDKASHPRSKEVILKKTGILQKCFCAALAALLLLTFFGCSKKPSQNAAITLPEQETSHAGQAGAIFAPSTEFVSADASIDTQSCQSKATVFVPFFQQAEILFM